MLQPAVPMTSDMRPAPARRRCGPAARDPRCGRPAPPRRSRRALAAERDDARVRLDARLVEQGLRLLAVADDLEMLEGVMDEGNGRGFVEERGGAFRRGDHRDRVEQDRGAAGELEIGGELLAVRQDGAAHLGRDHAAAWRRPPRPPCAGRRPAPASAPSVTRQPTWRPVRIGLGLGEDAERRRRLEVGAGRARRP